MTDRELDDIFETVRDGEPGSASELAEQKLRLAFRTLQRRNRVRRRAFEMVAAILIAAGLYFVFAQIRSSRRPEAASAGEYRASEFILLPYGQSDVPLEDPVIVRLQIERGELTRLGVPLPALPHQSRVEADLLVGQDGIARAVRVNSRF